MTLRTGVKYFSLFLVFVVRFLRVHKFLPLNDGDATYTNTNVMSPPDLPQHLAGQSMFPSGAAHNTYIHTICYILLCWHRAHFGTCSQLSRSPQNRALRQTFLREFWYVHRQSNLSRYVSFDIVVRCLFYVEPCCVGVLHNVTSFGTEPYVII